MTEPGDISDLVYADRYAWPGESLRIDTHRRVAIALAAREAGPERERHAAPFLENFLAGAIGAGRIMANAGAADGDGDGGATMVNCFVQLPSIPAWAGRKAWMRRWPAPCARCPWAVVSAMTSALCRLRTPARGRRMRRHRPLRPGLPGSGHAGRRRRGAQMGVLACDHPDLPAFLHAKAGRRRWPTLNLSVALSDRFLRAVENDEAWTLRRLPAGGRTGITARRAWRPWNMALCACRRGGCGRR